MNYVLKAPLYFSLPHTIFGPVSGPFFPQSFFIKNKLLEICDRPGLIEQVDYAIVFGGKLGLKINTINEALRKMVT